MLLIPIAQENNVVRRTPWVSLALIGLNVVVFLVMFFPQAAFERRLDQAFARFGRYLGRHPYLEVAPELSGRLGPGFSRDLARRRAADKEQLELPEEERARQQAELDELSVELLAAFDSGPTRLLGYVPARGGLLTAFSGLFVHGGMLHLLGNMLFLFLSGPFIEDRYGRPLFAVFYLAAGLVATVTHAAHAPDSPVPLIGASGAIAGVMGAFLVRLGRARIHFLLLPFPVIWMWRIRLVLPAFVVLPLWLIEQSWYATHVSGSGVAFWAHVGGFVFGLLAALAVRLTGLEERYLNPGIEAETTLEQHPALERALDARLRGDLPTARAQLELLLHEQPGHLDGWAESYELGLAAGDPARVGRSAARLLELYAAKGERELAARLVYDERWTRLRGLPARFLLAAATVLEHEHDVRRALELYEQVVAAAPDDAAALRALVRRGELLRRKGDAAGARAAYASALRHPACGAPWPDTIRRALLELERPQAAGQT